MVNYKHILGGLFTLVLLTGFGQKHEIEISQGIDFQSNFISNSFYNSFFTDGYLSESEIEDSKSKLSDNNLVFQKIWLGANYTFHKDSSLAYSVGLRTENVQWGNVDSDLFKVVMDGNASYKGETLSIPNSFIRGIQYEALRLGAEKSISDKLVVNAHVDLLKSGFTNTRTYSGGTLYTASDGSQVTLTGNYERERTSFRTTSAIGLFKGGGAAAGLEAYYTIDSVSIIYGGFDDLGFIHFGNMYKEDTLLNIDYTGYEIDNILTDAIDISDFELIDFKGLPSTQQALSFWLPASFFVGYKRTITPKLSLDGSVLYRSLPYYIPSVRLKTNYEFSTLKLNAFALQRIGGYSNYDLLLGIEKDFGDWASLRIQVNYIESLLLPKQSTSQSYNLAFVSYF